MINSEKSLDLASSQAYAVLVTHHRFATKAEKGEVLVIDPSVPISNETWTFFSLTDGFDILAKIIKHSAKGWVVEPINSGEHLSLPNHEVQDFGTLRAIYTSLEAYA